MKNEFMINSFSFLIHENNMKENEILILFLLTINDRSTFGFS